MHYILNLTDHKNEQETMIVRFAHLKLTEIKDNKRYLQKPGEPSPHLQKTDITDRP